MSWIESHQSLSRHKKVAGLVALLKTDRLKIIGHLHELWWWGLDNADVDGNLGDTSNEALAIAACWPVKDAKRFVEALIVVRFVDQSERGLVLHNWYAYAGKLMAARAANKERMQRARASHVPNTERARVALPYPTVPNRTQPLANASKAARRPRARLPVDPEYLKEIQPAHPTVNVCEVYADASNRKTWDGYKDKRRALGKYIGWAEEKVNPNGRTNTPARGSSRSSGDEINDSWKRYAAAHAKPDQAGHSARPDG